MCSIYRRKEPAKALPYLEHALPTFQSFREDWGLQRAPHFAWTQALVDSGGDRTGARKLAEEARAVWQRCGDPYRADLAAVTRWLKMLPEQSRPGS